MDTGGRTTCPGSGQPPTLRRGRYGCAGCDLEFTLGIFGLGVAAPAPDHPPFTNPASQNVERLVKMEYKEAFNLLKGRVQSLQRLPRNAMTQAERDEEDALVIALEAMKDCSGCFHPDEVVRSEAPSSRADLVLDLVERD